MPALLTEYENTLDNGGPDDTEEMLMILPPFPLSTIPLPNTWQAITTLFKLTLMM